eukprot:TRINITY_DN51771_c0_g1_i1.p1 TRINITY_DN51771_c0_g1~~TRINITY_DN51771_c0_g1_i1.p1  ORF type:complete len:560 (-),score=51.74 TRINITY_DN51771_c0_g1_i1:672-2351(-)
MVLSGRICCVWLRNDLRLHDNAAFSRACALLAARKCDYILPVYFWDPRFFDANAKKCPKTGDFRKSFVRETLLDLKNNLRTIGSDLCIIHGTPEVALKSLLDADRSIIVTQEEVTSEELAVDREVTKVGFKLDYIWGATMYHRDDLPYHNTLSDMPDVFTPFKQQVEKRSRIREMLPTPQKGQLPLPPELPQQLVEELPPLVTEPKKQCFQGGETAALSRLAYYTWDTDKISTYFETRNGLLGDDYATRLSPWLAVGAISPRKIYWEIKAYEDKRVANKSTYWVIFEMIWRDFFRFFAIKHGSKIFWPGGTIGRKPAWDDNDEALERWKKGETGWPFVDANMRELAEAGWMSNRGRQNVASFLVHELKLDWRLGAEWFEYQLIDYDVCSNWGNWVVAAGLTGGRINHFNIVKQGKDYDTDGAFVRHWCPELEKLPTKYIHWPWHASEEELQNYCPNYLHVRPPLANDKADTRSYPPNSANGGRGAKGKYRGYYKQPAGQSQGEFIPQTSGQAHSTKWKQMLTSVTGEGAPDGAGRGGRGGRGAPSAGRGYKPKKRGKLQ